MPVIFRHRAAPLGLALMIIAAVLGGIIGTANAKSTSQTKQLSGTAQTKSTAGNAGPYCRISFKDSAKQGQRLNATVSLTCMHNYNLAVELYILDDYATGFKKAIETPIARKKYKKIE